MVVFCSRTYIIATLLLLYSTFAQANAYIVGLQVSQAIRVGEFKTDFIAPTYNINATSHYEADIKDNGTSIGGLLGYEFEKEKWLLGIEASVEEFNHYEKPRGFHMLDSTNTVSVPGIVRYNNGALFVLSGRVGYRIDPNFLPYLRLGAHTSKDDFVFTPTPLGIYGATPSTEASSIDKRVNGWRIGGGLEISFFSPTVLRVEYNYAKTKKMTIHDNSGAFTGTHTFEPHFQSGTIAWVWRFT